MLDDRIKEIENLGCKVQHICTGDDKPLCVLGVLRTPIGISIRDEMLVNLMSKYDIYTVEQEPPGVLFEYPAIKLAFELSKELSKSCLYLHTKGAANNTSIQGVIRRLWYDEFVRNADKYTEAVNTMIPVVACPYTGSEMHTWFNGFMFNALVAGVVELKRSNDRYYYEKLFADYSGRVKVTGILRNNVTSKNTHLMFADMHMRYT